MAEDKFTIVDLRRAIAKQTDVDEGAVNAFLTQLISAIKEGLKSDKVVKISGLGTFKLQWVEPRKSVNVSTGEPIVIEGYQKLSFSPESSVKERINEPYADLTAVELDSSGQPLPGQKVIDPMKKFGEQAEEIKDLLADLGADLPSANAAEETSAIEAEAATEETTAAEEKVSAEEPAYQVVAETLPAAEKPEEKEEEAVKPQAEVAEKPKKKKQPKKFRPWLVAIITIVVLLLMLVATALFLEYKIESWANKLNGKPEAEEYLAEAPLSAMELSDTLAIDTAETRAAEEDLEPAINWYEKRDYTEFIGIETVREGSRLTWIAKRYYGEKDLWVFIYEANKETIKNPGNVCIGTKLHIPKLPDYILDIENPQTKALIDRLQKEYLNT